MKQSRQTIGIARFLDCFASLAMTENEFNEGGLIGEKIIEQG